MATPLTYHGLTSGLADGNGVRLQVATPSGLVREIPLERRDVMRILSSAVKALEQLDTEQRRAERGEWLHEADLADDRTLCGRPRREVPWSSVTTRTTCPECIAERAS